MKRLTYKRLINNKNWVYIEADFEKVSANQYRVINIIRIKSKECVCIDDIKEMEELKVIGAAKILGRSESEVSWVNLNNYRVCYE